MKKIGLVFLVSFFITVIGSSAVCAAEKAPLGKSHFSFKLDYIQFTDGVLDTINTDTGVYIALEGYRNIAPGLYLGGEVGWAYADGRYRGYYTDLYYLPLEFNIKYAVAPSPKLVIDFGAGISLSYAEQVAYNWPLWGLNSDWLFGGQVFMDINYVINNNLFIGLNGKYQTTEDFKSYDYSYDNWRLGISFGKSF